MSTAWILILVVYWNLILVVYWNFEKNEKNGYSHILLLNKNAFKLSNNMPVHRRTHMYIKSVPVQGYFPFFWSASTNDTLGQ